MHDSKRNKIFGSEMMLMSEFADSIARNSANVFVEF